MAELYRRYYDEAYQDEMGAGNVPGFKVMPVTEKVDPDLILYPFEKLKAEVRAARKIAVTDCVYRKEM